MRRVRGGLLAALAVLTACSDDGYTIDASSGVPIIENHRPAWGARTPWTVETEPSLSIPQRSLPEPGPGEPDLYHLTDAVRLGDGALVVANGYTDEIAFYDDVGRELRRVGGEGLEPGLFQSLTKLHLIEGSLWAFDRMGRWNVFDLGGELLGTVYMEPQVNRGGWHHVEPYANQIATLNFEPCCRPDDGIGFVRRDANVLRFDASGAFQDTITTLPGRESYVFASGGLRSVSMLRLSPQSTIHGGDRRLYVGSGDRMEIEVFGGAGAPEHVIRIPDYDLSLSEEEWQVEVTLLEAHFSDMLRRPVFAADEPEEGPITSVRVESVRPETKPAYSRFIEDANGNLWVGAFDPVMARRERPPVDDWVVFDSEGRWLGSIRTPEGLSVTEVGADYVLGLARVDDRSVVQLHRLSR